MSYTIFISEAAEWDIREAFLWYQEQKVSLGVDFEKQVTKTIKNIKKNPLKFQTRYQQKRIAFTKKFPYGIHFTISDKTITIVAVFHTSQNPNIWEER